MAGKSGQDDLLIAGLARGLGVAAAAREAGLSDRTARRRMADPEFRTRVDQARADMLSDALGVLSGGAVSAARALLRLLGSAKSEVVQLGAARALLDNVLRHREQVEFEQRLAALEQAAADGGDE